MDSLTEMGGERATTVGLLGFRGPTPSSARLHLFTSSSDIGALVLRP